MYTRTKSQGWDMRVYTQMKHCADVIGQGATSPLSRCEGLISIEAEAQAFL
jgi:hypothetical protein